MVAEAPLESTDGGLVPVGEGWFVLNAHEARFPQLGFNIGVLAPGQASCMYHREDEQEDFLVLSGECLLLIEGQERRLKAWDFVHCPAWTEHVFVGAGDGPCAVLAVGSRTGGDVVYPVSQLAQRHDAGVEAETNEPDEAYQHVRPDSDAGYREGWLPG